MTMATDHHGNIIIDDLHLLVNIAEYQRVRFHLVSK